MNLFTFVTLLRMGVNLQKEMLAQVRVLPLSLWLVSWGWALITTGFRKPIYQILL